MKTALTIDHPGWTTDPDSDKLVRVVEHQGAAWLACSHGPALTLEPLGDEKAPQPALSYTSSEELPHGSAPTPLVERLAALGTVVRLTNPSLWDALTTAILRQVVRARQARALYHRWCRTQGRGVNTPLGTVHLAPSPDVVLRLPDEAFDAAGAKFHRTALQSSAAAYLENRVTWTQLAPGELVKALVNVRRIGPWTASAAVADYTGDFAVYPHSDLAVRTWARRAAPETLLPTTERAFAEWWLTWAGGDPAQLHALTLFTLTWGSHARTDQHGDDSQDRADRGRG
jgi:3-methyladenine DNA glycosylase/8-oxoguanine DNA glycosylase